MITTTPMDYTFSGGIRLFGWIGLFTGILVFPFGLILSLFCLPLIVAKDLRQVDIEKRQFRTANSIFGLELGKWESLDKMVDIAIMRRFKGKASTSHQTMQSNVRVNETFEVVLLDSKHRIKKVVYSGLDKEFAKNYRDQLAEQLQLQKTKYDPQLSAQTAARRTRR